MSKKEIKVQKLTLGDMRAMRKEGLNFLRVEDNDDASRITDWILDNKYADLPDDYSIQDALELVNETIRISVGSEAEAKNS